MSIAKSWADVLAKDPCPYCGKKMKYNSEFNDSPTRDHIVPKWTGAILEYDNLAVCCRICNFKKNDQSLLNFISGIAYEKEFVHYEDVVNIRKLERVDVRNFIIKNQTKLGKGQRAASND